MAYTRCLAGIADDMVPVFKGIFKTASVTDPCVIEKLDVAALGRLAPQALVCDLDALATDPSEFLRQLRFVLPDCLIAVYSGIGDRAWGVACHIAGANCLLSKKSDVPHLSRGLRTAMSTGCYTDAHYKAEEGQR